MAEKFDLNTLKHYDVMILSKFAIQSKMGFSKLRKLH